MRLTRRQAFAVAAIIAVIVAGLVYFVLSRETAPEQPVEPQTVNVLVAAQDISPFTTITAEMLTSREMDVRAAPAGALNEPEQAIGKVSQSSIIQGQTITSSEVGPRSAQQGLTFAIPGGLRAVTVALDPISGVGGFVFPGDRVDVLSTFQQGEVAVTRTILQNVEVLAMNEQTTRPAATGTAAAQTADEPADQQESDDAPATIQVKSATLAVTPDQAQALLLSASKGAVHLALRPREEDTVVSLSSQTDWALMGMDPPSEEPAEEAEPEPEQQPVGPNGWPPAHYGPMPQQQPPQAAPEPQAQPEPEAAPTVEVFRGNEREVIQVD